MNSEKTLMYVAAVVMVVSLFSAGFTYYSVSTLRESIVTGLATSGVANLTVESGANINFTTETIEWGSGRVDEGLDNATLNTASGTVTDGNWTVVSSGFIIENIGNVNVSFNMSAGSTAAQFIGGTGPQYQWNITDVEAGSCLNVTGSGADGNTTAGFQDTSTSTTALCGVFRFADSADTIQLDLKVVVPSDSKTGLLQDTLSSTIVQV